MSIKPMQLAARVFKGRSLQLCAGVGFSNGQPIPRSGCCRTCNQGCLSRPQILARSLVVLSNSRFVLHPPVVEREEHAL